MKADLHVHTTASDGKMDPVEALEVAKEKRLDALAITDHDTMEGYHVAKDFVGDDLILIPGIEIYTNHGDVILLGVEEEPDSFDFKDVVEYSRENNGLTIGAHPFSYRRSAIDEEKLERLDAVEVLNGMTPDRANRKAREFAKENKMPQTGGSDAHDQEIVGETWTEVEGDNTKKILENIRKGNCRARGESLGLLSLGLTKLKNAFD